MSSGLVLGRMIGPLRIFNSTYGHCLLLRITDPFFSDGVRFFVFLAFFLRGQRTGGRSGKILILSWCDFGYLVFRSHRLQVLEPDYHTCIFFVQEPVARSKVKYLGIGNAEVIFSELDTGPTCCIFIFAHRSIDLELWGSTFYYECQSRAFAKPSGWQSSRHDVSMQTGPTSRGRPCGGWWTPSFTQLTWEG